MGGPQGSRAVRLVDVGGDECRDHSTCLAHIRCSSKWQQWLNHDITGVQGLKPYQNVLIGISVAFVLLLFLFVLLLIRHRQQGKCRTSAPAQLLMPRKRPSVRRRGDAAMKNTQPEEGVELHPQVGPLPCPGHQGPSCCQTSSNGHLHVPISPSPQQRPTLTSPLGTWGVLL
nr:leukocyte immunoglobulin-like receptor subfamily B member 5 [Equus caballus]